MDIKNLGQDRFLRKDPNQSDQTKDAVYASSNPAPKRGDDELRKLGRPKGSEEDDGAPNILTGTVIVSCFIQTSALPSRIELQGNDLTFFDDTFAKNGQVIGDTSRLIFTHASGKKGETITQGFIIEKRASIYNTYDNVISWYALPPKEGAHNYIFIGRNAYGESTEDINVSSIHFSIDSDSEFIPVGSNSILNGVYEVEYSVDHDFKARIIYCGTSQSLFVGSPFTGYSSLIVAGEGGISGLGYTTVGGISLVLVATSDSRLSLGGDIIPDTNGAYDIGSPSFKIGTFYGSVVACPLPTVENALEILDRIPAPVFVGERGHYGENRKYFDDLTFPEELLFTDKKGRIDIEHNHMIGFLLKAVIELKAEVDFLKGQNQKV